MSMFLVLVHPSQTLLVFLLKSMVVVRVQEVVAPPHLIYTNKFPFWATFLEEPA